MGEGINTLALSIGVIFKAKIKSHALDRETGQGSGRFNAACKSSDVSLVLLAALGHPTI
jgi:hypothetical protein